MKPDRGRGNRYTVEATGWFPGEVVLARREGHPGVPLHGFIKQSQGTPDSDLTIARARKAEHEKGVDNA